MKIGRRTVNAVRYVLEDLLPPALRDSPLFLGVMYLVWGRSAPSFIAFRDRLRTMSADEYASFYASITPIHGDCDLNRACVDRILAEVEGEAVLDAGCGRGRLAELIALGDPARSVTGADLAPPEGKWPTNLGFVEGWLGRLPFPDKAFDTVVCTHTLEHILDIDGAVADLRRLARRRLILVVPRERESRYPLNLHVHFFPYVHTFLNRIRAPDGRFACEILEGDIYYREEMA
ncbi:MAG TPA: class I SAM-dependent methyltransferase [Allosphingosinicella sp.]|jgi:SAM-dependent methyltransferase|nr:class I SAM-dependent methyltransferase [Allosphingosinicella sp.]